MKKEQAKALITWLLSSTKLKRTSVDGAVIGAPGTYAIRCGHKEWKDAPMYIGTTDYAYVVVARAYSKERIYVQSDVLYHDVFTLARKLLCRKRDTSLGQIKEKTWLDLAKSADPDFAWPSVDRAPAEGASPSEDCRPDCPDEEQTNIGLKGNAWLTDKFQPCGTTK